MVSAGVRASDLFDAHGRVIGLGDVVRRGSARGVVRRIDSSPVVRIYARLPSGHDRVSSRPWEFEAIPHSGRNRKEKLFIDASWPK